MTTQLQGQTLQLIPPFCEVMPDGEMVRRFHTGQMRAWDSTRRFIIMSGSTQVGKTCFGPHWLEREIEQTGSLGDYIAITATFKLLKLKMQPEFLDVFRDKLDLGVWHESDRIFTSHDRHHGAEAWRVIFASATNPESIESATAKAAWMDELGQHQFRRDSWEAVIRRLTLAQGRVLGTTTLYELGWLKTELYDRYMAGDEDIDWIEVDAMANPTFPRAEYDRQKRLLPTWKFNMFYRGKYDRPAGIIYDSFDEQTQIIDRFSIPIEWPRYVGHDFGPNNTVAVWYAQNPSTGNLFLYRTYHAGHMSTEEHVKKWVELSARENILFRVGGARHEQGWRDAATMAGWRIQEPKTFEVSSGIQRVYGWHKMNRLFVFRDCKAYIDEKLSYSYQLDADYQVIPDKIDQKSKFHHMDAERYVLSHLRLEWAETSHTETQVNRLGEAAKR